MAQLLHGDCLEEMKNIDDNSIDLIYCDLPYAVHKYSAVNCKWNTPIDLEAFWIQVMRIKKLNTPIFMTCTTKFGVSLINSAPKKCPFKYELCWKKSAPTGFLLAKKQPLRIFEMVYVFYEKPPFYDISSHKHKFLNCETENKIENGIYGKNDRNVPKGGLRTQPLYEPPLPKNVLEFPVKEDIYGQTCDMKNNFEESKGMNKKERKEVRYEPKLPTTMLEIKSTRGKHSTEKPVALTSWILKYYSKEGDVVLDPTMGSGGMGCSCRDMNRNFIGIEKDDDIYEVACARIWN